MQNVMGGSLLGFGVLKLRFGGMVLFSSAKDIFNKLDSPEAPSLCPKFVFTSRDNQHNFDTQLLEG